MLGIKLDKWQKDVLEAEGNIVVRSGRQCGKSTAISILAAREATSKPKRTVMVVASVERQAYLLFEKILAVLEAEYPKLIMKGKDRPTKSLVKLRNGSRIYCLPTGLSGYGIRGFTIDLLIADEAAFIPDEVYNALIPSLAARASLGARVVLLSTPYGRQGYFYEAFTDPTFTKFHVSSEECERIDKEWLKVQKDKMTKLVYTQEFLGEFVDELMQFFPDDLIKRCMIRRRPETIAREFPAYLGVDIARMGEDESTFEVIQLKHEKLIQIENQITRKTLLSDTTRHIIHMDNIYNFNKIFLDDEGIGVGVFDELITNEQTKRKTIPINNSKRVIDSRDEGKVRLLKQDLYSNLLVLMEQGKIELLDDPEIFQSLKSVQFEYTSDLKGKPMLKIFGNYTHIVEGLIRAAWCIKYKSLSIWVKSISI
jgi:hypothetical protein